MAEPTWLQVARKYIGIAEIHGPQNNPQIVEFWKDVHLSGIKNDEVPWCAGFVGACLELCEIRSTRADSARSYLEYGSALSGPVVGAIVVFERGESSGHVAFVVGRDEKSNLVVLGGNQGDKVCIEPFSADRVIGYRWPITEPRPQSVGFAELPLIDLNPAVAVSEDES